MLNRSAGNPSLLARIGAGIAVVLAVIAGLALSAFFFGFFLVVAGLFAAWLGWQRCYGKRNALPCYNNSNIFSCESKT